MRIEKLSIPDEVKRIIKYSGISTLYPPQIKAIKSGVLEGNNLVLATPTASGKTLVAELCALKKIIEQKGKVIYLTPLRALASEKYESIKKYRTIRKDNGKKIKVAISTGDYDNSDPWLGRCDIIITTNEKFDSLLRHKPFWIDDVKLIIVDEVHVLNDADRGPTLEVILSKLMTVNPRVQFLALSATIRNSDDIADWLKAESILTDWRPVKLLEGVYNHGFCQFNDGSIIEFGEDNNKISIFNLVEHLLKEGGQVLLFAETRKLAVNYALKLAPLVLKFLTKKEMKILDSISRKIIESEEKTRLSKLISDLIKSGVAFHHAGLSPMHRKLVEDAFRKHRIKVISATPTLAAGVNLPARTVIISSYERYESDYGRRRISVLEYKQMAGRAGRPKYDKIGRAILISRNEDEQEFLMQNYVFSKPEKIWSKLAVEKVILSHVLAIIASGFASSINELNNFFARTFYAHQFGSETINVLVSKSLLYLFKEKMVSIERDLIQATEFGHRISELYIDPRSAVIIRDGLKNERGGITNLSLIQLVCHTPDVRPKYYPSKREFDEFKRFVNVHYDEFITIIPNQFEDEFAYEEFLGSVKCSLVLDSWIQEVQEDEIIERYSVEPGDLFKLVNTVKWLLYSSGELCKILGYTDFFSKIVELKERVEKGVKKELLSVVSINGVGRIRGRIIFNAGFRNIEDLKRASINQLMSLPLVGTETAKKIKEQIGGFVKADEWKKIKENKYLKQKLIDD